MTKPTYKYQQHQHVETRKQNNPHEKKKARATGKSLNDVIGLNITKGVGTMWAAYVFFALSLVSLPGVLASGDMVTIVAWIAQTFLQLVLLPIIIVGQNLQAAESEKRAIATYDDAGAILEEAKEIQAHLSDQDKALSHLVDRLEAIEAKLLKQAATKKPTAKK